MFNKIGNEFLEIINAYTGENPEEAVIEERNIPQNIIETFKLLKKEYSLKDIASIRNLSEAVISMQIETIIEYEPEIDINFLYKDNLLERIFTEIEKGYSTLKEIKLRLPEEATYPLIRIAAAKYKFSRPPTAKVF
jgi:hypothetical protein